ncbi:MAG: carboxypeptidase regulatory-like domain-containing protein, partial [Acidobacteriota bacterium]
MTRTCSETLRLLVFAIFMLLPAGAFAEGAEPQQEAVAGVTGTVVDSEERPIEGAVVLLFGPNRLLLRQQVTAGDGSFTLAPVPPGNYELRVSSPPFRDRVRLVDVGRENVTVQIRFAPAEVQESVTVTASRGILQEDFAVAGTVRSLGIEKLEERAPDIVPRMVDEETGVIAQQTTPGQGSPILRGQGAQAVLYAVDGVRYNNATYRAGNTQYLAWIP